MSSGLVNRSKAMYAIPTDNLTKLEEKFAKLAKKASKLNVQLPTYTIVSTEFV
jgi:hemoglobin-like flavoprotein